MTKNSPLIKRFGPNHKGRDIAVGDIHGHFSRLAAQLQRIGFNRATDRLFAVGDLVDRGPESSEASRWLQQPWFHSVLGNHDLSVLAAFGSPDTRLVEHPYLICDRHDWMKTVEKQTRERLLSALAELPVAIEIETPEGLTGIVHAEVPHNHWKKFQCSLAQTETQSEAIYVATWSRAMARLAQDPNSTVPDEEDHRLQGIRHVIHGHSPARDLRVKRLSNRYYIDTGGWLPARPTTHNTRNPCFTLVDVREPWRPL